jgi:hypothetical protein
MMAPAVLGRLSLRFGVWTEPEGWLKSRSAFEIEMTDEILPESECPGRAVTVLEVSVETIDNGLGMYSSVSENPTLFRTAALGDCSSCWTGEVISTGFSAQGSGTDKGAVFSVSTGLSGAGKPRPAGRSGTTGLAGALFPFALVLDGGMMIEARSWLEMAADRR